MEPKGDPEKRGNWPETNMYVGYKRQLQDTAARQEA
jgi:hypothetical protein